MHQAISTLRAALASLGLLLAACTGDSTLSGQDGGGGSRDGGSSADGGAGTDGGQGGVYFDTAGVFLDECQAFPSQCDDGSDPNCGACQYRVMLDSSRCGPEQPCAQLVLLWAFAGCGVDGVTGFLGSILDAHPDVVTACVQPIWPGEILPSSLGAPDRDQLVVAALFEALEPGGAIGAWTGSELLMTGCSAAASRFPTVAARSHADEAWLGADKTMVCMSEGVVAVDVQDRFTGELVGSSASCAARHERIATGYTVAQPVDAHACSDSVDGQCACDPDHAALSYPGDCGDGDCVAFDSIITQTEAGYGLAAGLSAADFAVADWILISEGGAWADTEDRCELDTVPAEPFQALCQALDAEAGHRCRFESRPEAPHCAAWAADFEELCLADFL